MVMTLHGLALLLYASAGAVLAGALAGGKRSAPAWGAAIMVAAVLMHALALVGYEATYGELPLVGLAPSLSTLAFLIGAFLLIAAVLREGRPFGLVLTPLVVLLLGIALLRGVAPSGDAPAFRGAWFAGHVVLAFAGYAGLAIAFAAGLLYLLQFRALKSKDFGRVFRFFPSLEVLDRVGRGSLVAGFSALTVALVLGWAWTIRFQRSLATADPQVIWGVISWLIFAAALAARAGGAGGDRRGALASVVGFIVVVLAYMVLRISMADGRVFL